MDLDIVNDLLQKPKAPPSYAGVPLKLRTQYINPCPMYRNGFACMVRHLVDDTTVVTAVRKRGPKLGLRVRLHDDNVAWERILEGFANKEGYRTTILQEAEGKQDWFLVVGKGNKKRLTRLLRAAKMVPMTDEETEAEHREFVHTRIRHDARQSKSRDLGSLLSALAERSE